GSVSIAKVKPLQGTVAFDRIGDATLLVHLAGPWHLRRDVPSAALVSRELEATPAPKRISFDASGLSGWDSGLVSFLAQIGEACRDRGIAIDRRGLPAGLKRLLELADAVPEKEGARSAQSKASWL